MRIPTQSDVKFHSTRCGFKAFSSILEDKIAQLNIVANQVIFSNLMAAL
jgi:hypothetical protein